MGRSRRRRWPWVLLGTVVVLLVVVDLAAKLAVERFAEEALRDEERISAEGVDASVDSFPFLGRLLASGETSFSVTLDGIDEQGVRIDRFVVDVDGLVFDRGAALDGRARVESVDGAEVRVELTEESVSAQAGVAVAFEPGRAVVTGIEGAPEATAAVAGRDLTVLVDGSVVATLAIPSTDYLPCEPTVALLEGVAQLSCRTADLPPIVNEALGRVAG